jgi:4-amino-4-deoxy-L-arabinose transferase-like glycosyltransferase
MAGDKLFEPRGGGKGSLVPWVFVLVFVLLLGMESVDQGFSRIAGNDNPTYVMLARSIAEGRGLRDLHIPGHPPHTLFPPGLPLVLSPVYYFFGYNFTMMRVLILLAGMGSVYAIKLYFEKKTGGLVAIILALLAGTNLHILTYMGETVTEVPYLLFSLLALYWLDRYSEGKNLNSYAVVVCILVSTAYLTRMAGVALYGAGLTVLALKAFSASGEGEKRVYGKKLLYFSVLAAVPLVLWFLRAGVYSEDTPTYFTKFFETGHYGLENTRTGVAMVLERIGRDVYFYLIFFYIPFITIEGFNLLAPPVLVVASSFFLLITVVWGLIYRVCNKKEACDFYVLYFLLLIAAWPPYGQRDAVRFLIPVIPFLYFYFLVGVNCFIRLVAPGVRAETFAKRFSLVPCLVFLLINLFVVRHALWPPTLIERVRTTTGLVSDHLFKRVDEAELHTMTTEHFTREIPCFHDYIESAFLLGGISEPDDIIIARKPELVYIITGSHAVNFPFTGKSEVLIEHFEAKGVDYVLLDRCFVETGKYLLPFINEHPESFKPYLAGGKDTDILIYTGR